MTTILADFAKLEPYLGGNSFSSDLVTCYGRSGQTLAIATTSWSRHVPERMCCISAAVTTYR